MLTFTYHQGLKPWFLYVFGDIDADFGIWLLQKDGLRVPPFESHQVADSVLREKGLDAQEWQTWMHEMIRSKDRRLFNFKAQLFLSAIDLQQKQKKEAQETVADSEWPDQLLREHTEAYTSRPFSPLDFWRGSAEIGISIEELWEQYIHLPNRGHWSAIQPDLNVFAFWDFKSDLEPYYTRLDSLFLHLVSYPEPIDYPIPPFSGILSVAEKPIDREHFRIRVMKMAEALATIRSA